MSVSSALDYLGILAELPKSIRKERINELLKQVNLEPEKINDLRIYPVA